MVLRDTFHKNIIKLWNVFRNAFRDLNAFTYKRCFYNE